MKCARPHHKNFLESSDVTIKCKSDKRLSKKMTGQLMNHFCPSGHKVLPDGVTQNRQNLAPNLPIFVQKSNFKNLADHKFC